MKIPTLVRRVPPGSETTQDEAHAKADSDRSAQAGASPLLESSATSSPAVATRSRPTPAVLPARAPARTQPRPDGAYQYGVRGQSIAQAAPIALQPNREFPSIKALGARYPHVLAKIRAAWGTTREFDLLMRDLLLASRQVRAGFDPEALLELANLQEYHARMVAGNDIG